MSLDNLKEPQIDELAVILQELKVFHYVLPRKSIFIFGHGTCIEALRIKCVEKNIMIPIGRKQGSLQVTFDGREGDPLNDPNGYLIRENIGLISREVVQIFNRPGLLDDNGSANPEILDYLVENFAADNFSRQYVRCEDSYAAAVLAFDIPTQNSIPCSTLDESFPLVFIASPISAEEFEAISTYFAEEPRYFQHHSWIPALLALPVDKCISKSNAGPGVYHLRMRSWQPTNINQPRQEAGRIVVGRSNALRLLVYEHADLVVFVPAGGALLDLFDDSHSLAIMRHKAISKENVCFDFTTRSRYLP